MNRHWIVRWTLSITWFAVAGCGGGSAVPQKPATATTPGSGTVAVEAQQVVSRPETAVTAAERTTRNASTEPAADTSEKAITPIGLILPDPREDALDPKGPKLRRE